MKKLLLLILISLLSFKLFSQIIPAERRVDWHAIINKFEFKPIFNKININDFGGDNTGLNDNYSAFQSALKTLNGKSGVIFFPKGKYLFTKPIVLTDSIILAGEGNNVSQLIFNLEKQPVSAIVISGTDENVFVSLKGGFKKGSYKILTDSAFYFSAGDWVEVRENNGSWDFRPAPWAKNVVGQIEKVTGVSGDTVFLENPLRISYKIDLKPVVHKIFPIKNNAVKCLKIHRQDNPQTGGGYNIYFNLAINSQVTGIESDTSNGSHVYISRSSNIQVKGNTFRYSFSYDGSGTNGYGVTLAHHSGACLITNNVFYHLRHAMMVKTGANGNVFSYNYSFEPVRTEFPSDASGDISLHGHYPFANLFEGNVVQNIVIDHYWGPAGPENTFFRNRAELFGIIMTTSDSISTNEQNFVGNETTDPGFFHGQFTLTGKDNFSYGNDILGNIIPSGTNNLTDSSYYLQNKPVFWLDTINWPSVGIPNPLGYGTNPAYAAYKTGKYYNYCTGGIYTAVSKIRNDDDFTVYPNPAIKFININKGSPFHGKVGIQFISLLGKSVYLKPILNSNGNLISISLPENIPSGIYFLKIFENGNYYVKKVRIIK